MYRILVLTLIVCFLETSINGDDDYDYTTADDTSNLNFEYVDFNNTIDDEMDIILLYDNIKKGKEKKIGRAHV